MSRFKFPSISNDQIGYAYDSASTRMAFQAFYTYGDGLCQHSGEWAITEETATDYLLSFARAIIDAPDGRDMALAARYSFCGSNVSRRTIKFAATVKYVDSDKGKPQYYSLSEMQVTRSAVKRNDRRYERVETWMDGTPASVFQLCRKDFMGWWDLYQLAHEVLQIMTDLHDTYYGTPADHLLKWERVDSYDLASAFEHASTLVRAYSSIDVATGNMNRRHPKPASKETADVA